MRRPLLLIVMACCLPACGTVGQRSQPLMYAHARHAPDLTVPATLDRFLDDVERLNKRLGTGLVERRQVGEGEAVAHLLAADGRSLWLNAYAQEAGTVRLTARAQPAGDPAWEAAVLREMEGLLRGEPGRAYRGRGRFELPPYPDQGP